MNSTAPKSEYDYTNSLINETSPYLLQHAHNPVNWRAWNKETLELAEKEDKMLLISIGYAACHWCHVMEHESFEDEEVAKLMNDLFIPVKVDREERPDVDQVYMSAIQVMGQNGGWPLNFFALPDGRPFWGGTYFQKQSWKDILVKINKEYTNNRDTVIKYADQLTNGVSQVDENRFLSLKPNNHGHSEIINNSLDKWSDLMDNVEGGPKREQNKFPLPNAYQYLMRKGYLSKNENINDHIKLTLKKMAYGGIYDQIGGGFARYSVDKYWKVPHFEKMLYDNAQLVSLYSEAYAIYKDPLYKKVVEQTLEFVERELTDSTGAFYASLDADSEGEEGKYYVWSKEELKSILKDEYAVLKAYYEINPNGFWEGNYILLRAKEHNEVAEALGFSDQELEKKISRINKTLRLKREGRIRPGLDDKSLCSWNAMMTVAYVDAYRVFNKTEYLKKAKRNLEFIELKMMKIDGRLYHNYKENKSTIDAFLEDYAHLINAYIQMYQTDYDMEWVKKADNLMEIAIKEYYNAEAQLFYFTSKKGEQLVSKKFEVNDNVIPSANSVMAKNLYIMSYLVDKPKYGEIAKTMLAKVVGGIDITRYPLGYSNWMDAASYEQEKFFQLVIVGENYREITKLMDKKYVPYKIVVGSEKEGPLLTEGKYVVGETLIYVCLDRVCELPKKTVKEALDLLK
jgi:hypothetical protein